MRTRWGSSEGKVGLSKESCISSNREMAWCGWLCSVKLIDELLGMGKIYSWLLSIMSNVIALLFYQILILIVVLTTVKNRFNFTFIFIINFNGWW